MPIATPEEMIADAKARAKRGEKPAQSLGYCRCFTVWNIVALGPDCPDCEEAPLHIEHGHERPKTN
jgi:hypothetical protein